MIKHVEEHRDGQKWTFTTKATSVKIALREKLEKVS